MAVAAEVVGRHAGPDALSTGVVANPLSAALVAGDERLLESRLRSHSPCGGGRRRHALTVPTTSRLLKNVDVHGGC